MVASSESEAYEKLNKGSKISSIYVSKLYRHRWCQNSLAVSFNKVVNYELTANN